MAKPYALLLYLYYPVCYLAYGGMLSGRGRRTTSCTLRRVSTCVSATGAWRKCVHGRARAEALVRHPAAGVGRNFGCHMANPRRNVMPGFSPSQAEQERRDAGGGGGASRGSCPWFPCGGYSRLSVASLVNSSGSKQQRGRSVYLYENTIYTVLYYRSIVLS